MEIISNRFSKGALNNKREPEYVGTVKFKKYDDSIAISRFVADYNYSDSSNLSEKLVPPQEVIKLLRMMKLRIILNH